MIVFPHAKINLGLNVLRKRDDGFHDIETVMVPIPLHDVLEVVVDPQLKKDEVVYTRSGIPVEGLLEKDLCMRAVRSLQRSAALPGIRMHLHKVIPMGAGLGGGSSDAAHTLVALDKLLGLGLGHERLHALASELGSDCPFFLEKGIREAKGRGEILRPVEIKLAGHWLHLVHPGIHVPTVEVYAGIQPVDRGTNLASVLHCDQPEQWTGKVFNAMEPVVFSRHPEIGALKERLLGSGAVYASMSGSGSSVYGLFSSRPPTFDWPASYRSWNLELN